MLIKVYSENDCCGREEPENYGYKLTSGVFGYYAVFWAVQ